MIKIIMSNNNNINVLDTKRIKKLCVKTIRRTTRLYGLVSVR